MRLRLIVSVYLVGVAAILWLLLPRWWSGLSLLPLIGIWAVWATPTPHGRHELELELDQAAELEDQAAELEDVPAFRPSPELARWAAMPAADVDPVGHYAARAWQHAGPVWQSDLEREGEPLPAWAAPDADRVTAYGYTDGSSGSDYHETPPGPAALLDPPGPVVTITGGPAAADSDTGEAGPPVPELDHEARLEGPAEAELLWPEAGDLAADVALLHVRALFDKIREHFREGPA